MLTAYLCCADGHGCQAEGEISIMKIVTDCAADMPSAEYQALGIIQAPLWIQFPEGEVNSADLAIDLTSWLHPKLIFLALHSSIKTSNTSLDLNVAGKILPPSA
jgi:hypothetical protein